MVVSFNTVNETAAIEPKLTALAPVKPLPEMVTMVPPLVLPEVGLMLLTDAVDAAERVRGSLLERGEVPAAFVTVTSMVPAVLGGTPASMSVSLNTVNDDAR